MDAAGLLRTAFLKKFGSRKLEPVISGASTSASATVTVLLLNWKRSENLFKVIDSIRRQSMPIRIMLWNNNPDDHMRYPVDLQIDSSKNLYCWPRWSMASLTDSDFVFSLDDDLMLGDQYIIEDCLPIVSAGCAVGWQGVQLTGLYSKSKHCTASSARDQYVDIVKGRFLMARRKDVIRVLPPRSGLSDGSPAVEDDIHLSAHLERKVLPAVLAGRMKDLPSGGIGLLSRRDHWARRDRAAIEAGFNRASPLSDPVPNTNTGGARPSSVLILTHKDAAGKVKLPHLDWLTHANPDVEHHVITGRDSEFGRRDNWKNSDRLLRQWWRENSKMVAGDVIAVIEWDTLVKCQLPDLPSNFDLVGKTVLRENLSLRDAWAKGVRTRHMASKSWHQDYWWWWPEVPRLNLENDQPATGLVSFGMMVMGRSVLDSICAPRWDMAYQLSIQNELRFPTIAQISGARVGAIDLPFVSHTDVEVSDIPGIYHSVDEPQPPPNYPHGDNNSHQEVLG